MGSSAGGVEALPEVLGQLPPSLPASIVLVQHRRADADGFLVDLLRGGTSLAVDWARDGAPLEHGRVYVAPADRHVLISEDHVRLSEGARVNHARPSIDVLFRSAAAARGSRTIGVVLTGMLHDGVAGLDAIQRAGGRVVVQDPREASFPDLPRNAIEAVPTDRIARLSELGAALVELSEDRPPDGAAVPDDVLLEAQLDRATGGAAAAQARLDQLGTRADVSCPACGGDLWRVGSGPVERFRCYLGHVLSARELLEDQGAEVERAMWSAVRALQERARSLEQLAADSRRRGHEQITHDYERRAREHREQAELARAFLLALVRAIT